MIHTREATERNPAHKLEELGPTTEAIPKRKALIQERFTGIKSFL